MHNSETLWQEISVSAMMGTQRKPFMLTKAEGALGETLAALPQENTQGSGEAALLRAAAVTSLHRRAGKLPINASPFLAPACPLDEWPRCSIRAGSYLEIILSSRPVLLLEWLALAAQYRVRAREEQLPALLEHQKKSEETRLLLLKVIGERGRWLAVQNSDWSQFVNYRDESTWQEGQRKERLAYLTDLREEDPDRARAQLEATWEQEPPAERVAFLRVLANHLSMADEPFLESVLDDRRKDVRQAAAGLLACLPESRLVARSIERARRLLAWKSGLLRASLDVTLPAECAPAMQRDGIEAKPPAGSKMGEKAWWLAQILSMVPPAHWITMWGKRPRAVLDVIRKHEWEEALLLGWSAAAERFADTEWLEGLVEHHLRQNNLPRVLELFPKLPVDMKEKLVIEMLRDNPSLSYDQPASAYLSSCQHPWSSAMTQAVTTCICWTVQRGDFQPWRWEKLLRDISPYFSPDILPQVIDRVNAVMKKKASADPPVERLINELTFRLEMRQAFTAAKED